ncbi:PAS domain-containing sensor histidine kinase [Azospirillum sp.]|uniref:PAS domain-containing sensor histidine kinase n=1 Tax=Azospirillum sp. TaxID=34012 RepID=UPI003D732C3A
MQLSQRYFSALLANSSDVMGVLSRDGRFTFVGDNVRKVFGHTPETLMGRPLADFAHPADRVALTERLAFRAASPQGSFGTSAFRMRDSEGGWRHVEATGCNLLDDPEVRGMVGNIRDITERVEAERRRRESEVLYHTLAEAAPVGMFRVGANGRMLFANRRMAVLTGLPATHIMDHGWIAAVHPADRPRIEEEWARCLSTGVALMTNCRLLGAEGTTAAVFLQTTPVRDAEGTLQGCIGSLTDMSEYVRTAEALMVAEARNRSVVEAAADAILTVDEEGIVHSFNPAAEAMFGLGAAEIVWHRLDRLIPGDVVERHKAYLRAPGEPGKPVAGGCIGDIRARRADGTLFPIELSVAALEVQGRRLFTAIVRDVTERKRIEAELIRARDAAEAADLAKSAFLATMSHELRTPLNAVIGFAQVIEMRLLGPDALDRYTEYASSIRQSGEHLLGIIDDILDISKIEAGSLQLGEAPVDVADVLGQSLNLIAMQAGKRGVAVTLDLERNLPPLRVDELRLRQILVNLLSNAVKFSDTGGQVTVGARRADDGGLEFVVRDEGVGMAPEDIPKALERFSQVDQSMTRRHEGTGLGLPLTKRLVELHGGSLRLDSALGEGTTVTVRLPAARVMRLEDLLR